EHAVGRPDLPHAGVPFGCFDNELKSHGSVPDSYRVERIINGGEGEARGQESQWNPSTPLNHGLHG
ncbi:MAG TPA: hypothetical protein PKV38_19190, partial [bacterium]|nr:hypothetical protein [bacterium]